MKTILILSYTDLKKDPRPYRQISFLKSKGFRVVTVGLSKSSLEDEFFQIRKINPFFRLFRLILLLFKFYHLFYWDKYKKQILKILYKDFDVVIAHEVRLLPLAFELANGKPVILDAHEYSPLNFDDSLIWRLFIKDYYKYLCDTFIPKVSCILTVSDGIVNMYIDNYKVPTYLIVNLPSFEDLKPTKNLQKIRLIHHGIVSSSRKLELMIDAMEFLDENLYELNLILVRNDFTVNYYHKLINRAKRFRNINFLEPVPREELIEFCNQFDLGIIFCPPTNFNIKHGLPNKFFEFVQSRLGIIIGPDIEMSKYVLKYELGVRAKDWSPLGLASAIKLLERDEIFRFKSNSDKVAHILSSEEQNYVFLNIINQFL
ncbi:glycosyltransferase family protein [Algoriphagus taiwanensis]|uniref:Glycosyltransferase family 4 protein n=1 Tax=Algoriphagus taiwanensis TaxID=1445656 RepID=A0ABQ6Q2U3_9BACT|nr:glycosyltransferase family 4 protein [Algoriphagus taiwanensis]